jgi:hypothetical protein
MNIVQLVTTFLAFHSIRWFTTVIKKVRKSETIKMSVGVHHTQNITGKKVNVLGGHSIDHSKQKKSAYIHVYYSERFPREGYFTVQFQNC